MTCDSLRELLPLYAVGALSKDERASVEVHLDGCCADCRRELDELLAASHMLIEAEPLASPPARLKAELLSAIEDDRNTLAASEQGGAIALAGPRSGRRWRVPALLLATAASLALWLSTGDRGESDPTVKDWREQVAETENRLGVVGTRLVSLETSPTAPGECTLLYDEASEEVHVWVVGGPVASGRIDLLNARGEVLASAHAEPLGRYLAVVVPLKLDSPQPLSVRVVAEPGPAE